MHDKMMKMMMSKKKSGSTLSDGEKKAKLQALMGMKDLADSHMGNKLKNLKKVTVASDSPEGIKAGLHKAEDMVEGSGEDSDDTKSGLEDSDMLGEMNKYSEGGDVMDVNGQEGGHVAKMPPAFDTDLDNAKAEDEKMQMKVGHDGIQDGYADGTPDAESSAPSDSDESSEHDSVDQLVQESPDDPSQLEELIQKLQEKCEELKNQ